MIQDGARRFTNNKRFSGILLLLFLAFALFPTRAFSADKPEDELDARFSWTIKWEEEVGTGKTQQKGSCTIQMSGKIVRFQEEDEEDDSEFLVYRPKGMNATYKYNNKWYNIKPTDKCYGLIAEENASGAVKIITADEATGPGDGMFELQAFLGYGGQIAMMAWLAQASPEVMMDLDKQPTSDNYVFKLFVPFKTQVEWREDCFTSEPSLPRTFLFELFIDEYKKTGMSGALDHIATAHTFQQLGYGSCCGVTRYTPSEGSYNTTSTVSWTFGKVATLQILFWDKDLLKWVNINSETVDVITGEQIKLKARILPEEEGPITKGQWTIDNGDNENGKFIKKYDASFRKGEVLRLNEKELQQPEVTFYWTDEGKAKVTYEATANNQQLAAETEFNIRKPKYDVTVKAAKKSSIKEFGKFKPLNKNTCWVAAGPDIPGGTYFIYDGIRFTPEPLDGIEGKTQWVQILENDKFYWIYKGGAKEKCKLAEVLDRCYPYPAQGVVAEDTPGLHIGKAGKPKVREGTSDALMQAGKTQQNRMYLMFKPEGESSQWIPLKIIRWTWDGRVGWDDYKEEWKIFEGKVAPENPRVEDTSEYPEWKEGKNAGNPAARDCWLEGN